MAEIQIRGVTKVFPVPRGEVVALQDVSLTVADGEFVAIVGASGSGKSTLLNLVAGFDRPTGGETSIDGKAISKPGPDRGVMFQQSSLFPWLSVRENVGFGLRLAPTAIAPGPAVSTSCSSASALPASNISSPRNCPAA